MYFKNKNEDAPRYDLKIIVLGHPHASQDIFVERYYITRYNMELREFDKIELTELFERGMTIERKFNCMGERKKLEFVEHMKLTAYARIESNVLFEINRYI